MKHLITAITITLMLTTSALASGMLDNMMMPRQGFTGDAQIAYSPYCIEDEWFMTGINISIDSREPITVYVFFFDAAQPYYFKPITVGPKGWTGLASSLLPAGMSMHSGNTLAFISDGAANGRFWVTQFLLSPNGFSHVVQASEVVR